MSSHFDAVQQLFCKAIEGKKACQAGLSEQSSFLIIWYAEYPA
jgi:hypothetical protein